MSDFLRLCSSDCFLVDHAAGTSISNLYYDIEEPSFVIGLLNVLRLLKNALYL